MINREIGNRLKAYRNQRKLSQTVMAEILGLTRSTYAGHERGELNFNATLLIHICNKTSLNIYYLFYGSSNGGLTKEEKLDNKATEIYKELNNIQSSIKSLNEKLFK